MLKNYPKLYLRKVSFCFPLCLSVYLLFSPYNYLSAYPTVNPIMYLSLCLFVHPSDRASCRLSVRHSVSLFICPSIHPFLQLSVCPSECLYIECHNAGWLYSYCQYARWRLVASGSASLPWVSWHHYNYNNGHLAIFSTMSPQRTKVSMNTSSRKQNKTVSYLWIKVPWPDISYPGYNIVVGALYESGNTPDAS